MEHAISAERAMEENLLKSFFFLKDGLSICHTNTQMTESDDSFLELHVSVPSLILRQGHGFWLFTMTLHPESAEA